MRFHEAIHGVYFDDLDVFRILHNSRYVLLFERTIGSFWNRVGAGGDLSLEHTQDRFHVVRTNHIEYLRPVDRIGDVRVRVWIEKLGRTSITFGCRLLPMDEDVDYATATRVLVNVDPKTKTPVPWSDGFRQRVAPYVREQPAQGPGEAKK